MEMFKRFYRHFTPIFSGLSVLAIVISACLSAMYFDKPAYFHEVHVALLFDSYVLMILCLANIFTSIVYFILARSQGLKETIFAAAILLFNLGIIACWYLVTANFAEQFPIFGLG